MGERSVWEIRVGLYGTEAQADDLARRIALLLCPDPDHASPCPIPWAISTISGEGLDEPDAYAHLVEQDRIENPPRP